MGVLGSVHISGHALLVLQVLDVLHSPRSISNTVTASSYSVLVYSHRMITLPEIRGHPIVGLAKIFHNSFNWMCTFSMGIIENNKLPNFRSSRLL